MKTDVLIVGSGCSALYMALHLPEDLNILMVTKKEAELSDSFLAQGGICMLRNEDDYDSYFEDTMKAGHYENDAYSVELMIKSSPDVIQDLISYGVDFERNEDGSLAFTREGAHSQKRILYHEDITGKEITRHLLEKVRQKKNVTLLENTPLVDLIVRGNVALGGVIKRNNQEEKVYAKKVVLAPGRDGSAWLTKVLSNQGLKLYNNQVDIGVRVETSNIVMEEINKNLYEGKFVYNTSVGTKVRTFCSNPSGHVVIENHSGTMLANGHAYHDPKLGSKNTNFALLVSHTFSEPFNEPNEFAHEISKLANKLSNGSVIVQRYGDIKRGRRTTYKRLKEGYTDPTLPEAVPGDLGLVLPYNTMKSIIEMIEALDNVTPGIANEHTLLYGVEAKFYSARPKVGEGFESEIADLYVAGDGAGLTRGLAQAGANGILVARHIVENIK